ncbi:hypothetical protein LOS15_15735 [Halomonas sp. 7T]|uniref:hypothetical protein n=1 Tax=Halomonas sp. 7T TaxID=2893469 RepID=UPI0021D84745|nr:hypothetical protein [Halomonas sp. 7T]UXZ54240.1 hypothetical protein LOS15_15735 [Halomonas sp. 7T]
MDDVAAEALLFQMSYITMQDVQAPMIGYRFYSLGFPNWEVESSLNEFLLPVLGIRDSEAQTYQLSMFNVLLEHDLAGLKNHLKTLYAGFPPRRVPQRSQKHAHRPIRRP